MNEAQFASLVRDHQAQVFRYLRYLGASHELADDLTQETFLALCARRRGGRGEAITHPAGYLRTVAKNLFVTHCRRRPAVSLDASSLERREAFWTVKFGAGDDMAEHIEALRACLAGLPDRQRSVLDLHYTQGKSRAQIAEAFGLTEDGVKTLMRRVRAALALCIEGRLRRETRS